MPPVSIVGLGKLGASMVAAIASRGGEVIGVDVNPDAVAAVAAGRAPVQETDLDATLAAHRAPHPRHARCRRGGARLGDHLRDRADAERRARRLLVRRRGAGLRGHRPRACATRTRTTSSCSPARCCRAPRGRRCCRSSSARSRQACRRRLRPVLQPRVHRARQRHPRLPQPRLHADRRDRRARRRHAGGLLRAGDGQPRAGPAHEPGERRARQDLRQQLT